MADDAGRIESLFAAAAALPDDDARTKFLDDVCADDPGLRADLERLLHAHARSRHWLDEPAASGLEQESPPADEPLDKTGEAATQLRKELEALQKESKEPSKPKETKQPDGV